MHHCIRVNPLSGSQKHNENKIMLIIPKSNSHNRIAGCIMLLTFEETSTINDTPTAATRLPTMKVDMR
jgi:hypothetical protein